MPVCPGGPFRKRSGMPGFDSRHCVGGTLERSFGKLRSMSVADCFASHGAQPEPLVGVEAAGFQPAVVEDKGFAFAILDEELAVIGAVNRVFHDRANRVLGNVELVEKPVGHALAPMRICAVSAI